MKVISKKLEDGHIWLDCLANEKEVADAFDKGHIRFANQMGLQPEQGKTVAQVAQEKMGIKDLDSLVADTILELFGPAAITKRGIVPACKPELVPMGPLQRGQEFAFRMVMLPKPVYELSSYDPVEVVAPRIQADPNKVQALLDDITNHFASLVSSGDVTPVVLGDTLLLKMESTLDGNPFAGMTFERRPYVTGKGYMPDGFDENLVGMAVGEEKSFEFQAPTFDDQGNTVSETISCTVKVLEKQTSEKPELTDEWVKRFLPGYGSAAELRAAAQHQVESERDAEQQDVLQQLVSEKLAERFEGKIPDEVYESQMREMHDNIEARMVGEGKSFDDFVQEMGGEQQATMMMMFEIRQNLTQNFALDALFKHEKLSVKDSDIDAVCALMNPQDPKRVRADLESMGQGYLLKESAERLVAAKWAVEHAQVTYEDEA